MPAKQPQQRVDPADGILLLNIQLDTLISRNLIFILMFERLNGTLVQVPRHKCVVILTATQSGLYRQDI